MGLVPDDGRGRHLHRLPREPGHLSLSASVRGLQFAISVIGVLIFAGLTAYETQKLKEMYLYGNSDPMKPREARSSAR